MNKKEYPKAVVLRRGLVGIAILGVSLVVVIIFYNLYHSTHDENLNSTRAKSQAAPATASNADIDWYQNEAIRKPIIATATVTNNQIPQQSQGAIPMPSIPTQQNSQQQDYLKAMSAAISTNQITADQSLNTNRTMPGQQSSGLLPNGMPNTPDNNQNMQIEKKAFMQMNNQATDSDYLGSVLRDPISPYEIKAGTIIPGILITGINSDLPGQITAQVRSNVYDTIAGKYLLIPQGAKLTGLYDSQVAYGQERVLIVWKRIIFPNGQSIDLQGMPGVDMSGYAGFKDKVNNHYVKIFGSVLLMSILSAGAQLSQPQQSNNPFAAPTVGQTIAQSLGTNIANTGTMITAKNINIQPTLEIRPGYLFNISVTKDMVFPSPYSAETVIGNDNS